MSGYPALAYNMLVIEANRLGRRMRLLHEAIEAEHNRQRPATEQADTIWDDLPGDDIIWSELPHMHRKLTGIGAVLALLRETPNAYINPEAMAALRDEVEHAAAIEREDWAKAILDRVDPPLL